MEVIDEKNSHCSRAKHSKRRYVVTYKLKNITKDQKMKVWKQFVKKTTADTTIPVARGTHNPATYKEPTLLDRVTHAGTIKFRIYIRVRSDGKFISRQIVYVVEGRKKGQVGRVVNMGILGTRLSFTGTVGDTGIRSLKRPRISLGKCEKQTRRRN